MPFFKSTEIQKVFFLLFFFYSLFGYKCSCYQKQQFIHIDVILNAPESKKVCCYHLLIDKGKKKIDRWSAFPQGNRNICVKGRNQNLISRTQCLKRQIVLPLWCHVCPELYCPTWQFQNCNKSWTYNKHSSSSILITVHWQKSSSKRIWKAVSDL